MAAVTIYLNFMGNTEEAFAFYQSVFGGELSEINRMRDVPGTTVPDDELDKVMHVQLPILDGTLIMGTDALESMGQSVTVGNNTTINLEPDTLAETQRLYDALSEGSPECVPLQLMPWGHWGICLDRFGIRWMFNYSDRAE